MKTNKLIKLTDQEKRSIEIETAGQLVKILNNTEGKEPSERLSNVIKAVEKLLNEEKSIFKHELHELENKVKELETSLQRQVRK